jgi:hypothetical protein
MNLREFITLLGGATAWPLAVRAQQPGGPRRVGILVPFPDDRGPLVQQYLSTLRRADRSSISSFHLADLGGKGTDIDC